MSSSRRLAAGIGLVAAVAVAGTLGFRFIEGLATIDALYMTVITISTVGFREIGGELSTAGKILTMVVILSGTGAALYTAVAALEYIFESVFGGQLQERRTVRQAAAMRDHIILCGFGRVGNETWAQLATEGVDVVVIDIDEERITAARERGALAIVGNATHDEVLAAAGIARAKVLIAAVASDSDNLVITISAKSANEDVLVISRALDAQAERNLFLAGADRVVTPQLVGAQRLASLAVHPDLVEFIDLVVSGHTVEFRVEEITIGEGAEIAGKSLRQMDLRRRSGALVLAMGPGPDRMVLNPSPDLVLEPGFIVVAVGTADQLNALREVAAAPVRS